MCEKRTTRGAKKQWLYRAIFYIYPEQDSNFEAYDLSISPALELFYYQEHNETKALIYGGI